MIARILVCWDWFWILLSIGVVMLGVASAVGWGPPFPPSVFSDPPPTPTAVRYF